jgi:hypothetical protein
MKLNLKKQLPEIAGLVGGGVAGNILMNKLPFGNDKIRPAVVLGVGIFLSGRKDILGSVGKGMIVSGGNNLAKAFGIGQLINGVGTTDRPVFVTGAEDTDRFDGSGSEMAY